MKILLVDDNEARASEILRAIANVGPAALIQHVNCASSARGAMRTEHFDLLLLDVVIPNRPGDEPASTASVALISEIVDSDLLLAPRHIVGLTAFADAYQEVLDRFEGRLWALIRTDHDSAGWVGRIVSCVRFILLSREGNGETGVQACDVLLLTALREPEMLAVHRLPWSWGPEEPFDDNTFLRRASFVSDGRTFSIATSVSQRMGMVSTSILATKLISRLRPRLCILAGICGGFPGRVHFGDVVAAAPSWDWQAGKWITAADGLRKFQISPHQIQLSDVLYAHLEQLKANTERLAKVRSEFPSPPAHVLRLVIGPMASGSSVIADEEVRNDIALQQRQVVALDMESYGVYCASATARSASTMCVTLKGVCDFADPSKVDEMQAYASYTSASLTKEFLEIFGRRILESGGA